jgi:hypothetical protein
MHFEMKSLFLFSFLFLLIGCSSSKELRFDKPYGRSGNQYYVNLELRSDSTFTLTKASIEWPKKCVGTWSYLGNDQYKLVCEKEEPILQTSTGYLEPREHIITILSNRKVRIEKENTILKVK